jgi:hypothetical protein
LVLKFVGLEDAEVNLYRKDSVWNYQFLADYFSPKTPAQPGKKSKMKFNLQKIDFKNVSFIQNDLWAGQKMELSVGSLLLDAEDLDLDNKRVHINEIDLVRPVYSIQNFDELRPPRIKKAKVDTGYYFNDGDLKLTIGKLTIKNGTFNNENITDRKPYASFDGAHIRFDKINGSVNNLTFLKDTIRAQVELATKERSGFEVKKLKSNFRLTPQIMEFSNLDLVTPESHLRDYYSMSYKDFSKDFSHYIEKVTMNARITNSVLDSDDLAYFAPAAKNWKKRINIAGILKGTVDALNVKNLFIRSGNSTIIRGDLNMIGLPDIDNTLITFSSGNVQTNYRDVAVFVPSITRVTTPSLSSLGNVQFNGNFSGTISKFVTSGTFSTQLGGFSTHLTMQVTDNNSAIYNGRIVTRQFNIGKFLRAPEVGRVTFDGTIKGSGLDVNTLKTSINGTIAQVEFNDYNYQRIGIEGTFQKKQFDGSVKIDDPNINLTTAVKIDLRNAQPHFNVLGDLVSSDFQNLKLSNRRFRLSGLFDLNFTGKNIDQFLGSVKIFNSSLLADSIRLQFDSLSLQSSYIAGHRSLSIRSNEFDVAVEGKYNILDLPTSFQLFLHKYYPAYINEPKTSPKDQQFSFSLNTRNIEGYTKLLDKNLQGFSNSQVAGTINTIDTIFSLDANVPDFAYQQYRFTNTKFIGEGNLDNINLNGEIGLISITDSTVFPNTKINIISRKDVSQVSIQTKATNTLNELNFNADVYTLADGVRIFMRPSDFVINDKRWVLEKEGEIVIRKNFVSADRVRFTQDDQEIAVETVYDDEFDKSNLVVKLANLNIADFAPFITTEPRLEGIAGGEIILKDFYSQFQMEANVRAEQFRLDDDSIGVVTITGGYNSKVGRVNFNVGSTNELYNFVAGGYYNLKDSVGAPLSVTMKLNHTKIDMINRFLSVAFDNVTGFATGELNLRGKPTSPVLTGRVALSKAALTVIFTQVRYTVDSAYFVFDDDVINFGNFSVKDKFGNAGQVQGKLYQKGFKMYVMILISVHQECC